MRASKIDAVKALLAVLLLALMPHPASAQGANHISAELVAEGPAAPGGTVELALVMTPEEGWHGYWVNPGDAGYGMDFDWSLPPGWEAGTPDYPVPQTLSIAGLMNHVYEGPYAVLVPFSVPGSAAPGSTVPVTLEAQWLACTDEICVPERGTLATMVTVGAGVPNEPRFDDWRAAIPPLIDSTGAFEAADGTIRLEIPLPASLDITHPHLFLENAGVIDYAAPQGFKRDGNRLVVRLERAGEGALPDRLTGILKLDGAGGGIRFSAQPGPVAGGGIPLEAGEAGNVAGLPSFAMLVLLALAGGLLLNIMPCVFPILSLKALSLARAGESEAEARREGLAYTAGVVLACLALGGVMLALRAAGNEIGWAFQLQEPGVVVFLLVLASAITANFAGLFELPGISITRSGQPLGAFATGLLAAFVATPCTGPFMAAAMGAALLLPPLWALLLFAALGLGLALPFLALGFVPPLRRMLPRPGAWMETFRKILAIPMGLTALGLLWLTWRLGGGVFAGSAAIGAAAFVLMLVTLQRGRRIVALGQAAIVLAMVLTGIATFDPPAASTESSDSVVDARPFSEAALAEARATGKPVFVWFTADWCLTCKVNESVAIEREATRDAFEKAGVIALVGDWTRRDPEITRFLTAQGAGGIPLYLWYPPSGEAQQLPQVLTPDSLVDLAKAP